MLWGRSTREYHCAALHVVAHKLLNLFFGVVVLARLFPYGEKRHGVPAVWLGTDGMYPFACYAARRWRAFFVKVQ
ncbi:hypothetical protein [Hydrogeniiclostridium mannosilyticum]|uniref:hypothetical protein n=1 Tax=Hydrogeniiclostridium mannosilyticum TaxID=2764322 RepID=UPI0015AEEF8F|nr:hypothetical protein [Hydrogeniiclostridium mannosilyticum]